jgi:hypothetical protein
MRWAARGGACGTYETAETYRDLVGKPEGKQLVRQRHKWEDKIKMNLQEIRWGMVWISLVQDSYRWRDVVNAVMNLRVP